MAASSFSMSSGASTSCSTSLSAPDISTSAALWCGLLLVVVVRLFDVNPAATCGIRSVHPLRRRLNITRGWGGSEFPGHRSVVILSMRMGFPEGPALAGSAAAAAAAAVTVLAVAGGHSAHRRATRTNVTRKRLMRKAYTSGFSAEFTCDMKMPRARRRAEERHAVHDVQRQPAEGEQRHDQRQRLGQTQLLMIVALEAAAVARGGGGGGGGGDGGLGAALQLPADEAEDLAVERRHDCQRSHHAAEEVEVDHVVHAHHRGELAHDGGVAGVDADAAAVAVAVETGVVPSMGTRPDRKESTQHRQTATQALLGVTMALYLEHIVGPVALGVSCVLGNVLTIGALVWSTKRSREPHPSGTGAGTSTTGTSTIHSLLSSLAVADLLVGGLAIPLAVGVVDGRLEMSARACLLASCLLILPTLASVMSLLAIAVDRYLRVYAPFRRKDGYLLLYAAAAHSSANV
ncbi:LOW QUALITY PROTEIN: hypothetical protein CRUP_030486 [Coryphaenoides rupestris]|nr:LOW QUALITY PROTEIN: hypothetical protein CRUP_030486 [Coryphaenoides rupestris]